MKPEFYSIDLGIGIYKKGICDIKLVPKEWVSNLLSIDFTTGKIIDQIQLYPNKSYIAFQFIPKSYRLHEKPKQVDSGELFEITISGKLNKLTAASQQTLLNAKTHELIVICTDVNNVKKIIGNNEYGATLQFEHDHGNDSQIVDVNLYFQSELSSPFYTPPDSSTQGNVLATEDGDILITEDGNQIEVE